MCQQLTISKDIADAHEIMSLRQASPNQNSHFSWDFFSSTLWRLEYSIWYHVLLISLLWDHVRKKLLSSFKKFGAI